MALRDLVELAYARICAAPYPPTVGARVDRVGVAGQLESSDACWADHIPQPRGLVVAAGAYSSAIANRAAPGSSATLIQRLIIEVRLSQTALSELCSQIGPHIPPLSCEEAEDSPDRSTRWRPRPAALGQL